MQRIEKPFDSLGGVHLHQRRWTQDEGVRPTFTVLGVHGLGEHSGRYDHVGAEAVARGGELCMLDLPGHGKSSGKRGHISRFLDILADVALFHQTLHEEEGKLVVFVLGHSLGGLIAARYAQENSERIRGVILSGPALEIAQKVPGWQVKLGEVLSRLAPSITMANNIDPAVLSRDASVGEAYAQDPLVHRRISARLYTEIVAAMDEAHARASEMSAPLLLVQGGADVLCAVNGGRRFVEACGSADKTMTVYDGAYHEVFNETNKDAVLRETFDWITQHL